MTRRPAAARATAWAACWRRPASCSSRCSATTTPSAQAPRRNRRTRERDLPLAVLASLGMAMAMYLAISLVLTGMVPYNSCVDPSQAAGQCTEMILASFGGRGQRGVRRARPALGQRHHQCRGGRRHRQRGVRLHAGRGAHLVRAVARRPVAGLVRQVAPEVRHAASADHRAGRVHRAGGRPAADPRAGRAGEHRHLVRVHRDLRLGADPAHPSAGAGTALPVRAVAAGAAGHRVLAAA
ncbi:hypothetical protein RLIN73S_01582 [Rhodanobacter lindaniclasticus]